MNITNNDGKIQGGDWHFTRRQLECVCGCGSCEMDNIFMDKLIELQAYHGKPLLIKSAYRCSHLNQQISNSGLTGPHVYGRAVDILVNGPEFGLLVHAAVDLGFTGIGIMQDGPIDHRYIHLNTHAPVQQIFPLDNESANVDF